MATEGSNALDGPKELETGSDPEAEMEEEQQLIVEEEEPSRPDIPLVSQSNISESLTNFLPSETGDPSSNVPLSEMAVSSVSEGVLLEPSYNILGRIVFDEEEVYEEIELEEEMSEPTVITMDCIDDMNRVEIVEEGYRRQGTLLVPGEMDQTSIDNRSRVQQRHDSLIVGHAKIEEKCTEKKSPFFRGQNEQSLGEWKATLDSANPKISMFDPPVDELVRSLSSSKTYILKSKFDSNVIPGIGEAIVDRYTLCNDRIEVDVINLGARVTAVRIFDEGKWVDVALGLDNVAGYLSSKSDYMGGTIGRVADRTCNGKFTTPCKKEYHLSKNDGDDHYNGGFRGLHKKMWDVKRCGDELVMICHCYENEEGYPGNMTVWTSFSLSGDMGFNVEYYAKADSVTPVNITNAIYFNLAGHSGGPRSIYDHSVFVNAEAFCEPENICEGTVQLVYKSPYNLTDLRHLGCIMKKEGGHGLDVPYILYRQTSRQVRVTDPIPRPPMKIAAIAHHEDSGRTLVVSSNQWGLRLYTCNKLQSIKGKGDALYQKHSGFCFQPGNLPNSANIDHFPEAFITPQESYRHTIRYSFSVDRAENKKCKMFMDRTPWLQDNVFLKCDICPKEDKTNAKSEQKPPYKKTYAALEKLATRTSKVEDDDDDSLSIHSSFTSFGSGEEIFPEEGESDVEGTDEVAEPVTFDQSECTPKVVVKEPFPLPPYLTGKWPRNPVEPPATRETPQRRICPTEASLLKPSQPLLQQQIQNHSQPNETEHKPSKKQREKLKEIKLMSYTPVNIGVIERSDENRVKLGMDPRTNIPEPPNTLDLSDSSVESEMSVKNPVLGRSGDWNFNWMESVEKLPWYSSKLRKPSRKPCYKHMGKLFRMINFPQQFFKFNETQEEVVGAIKLRNQFLKSVANSIEYSPGQIILY